jgi:hypothetical protein
VLDISGVSQLLFERVHLGLNCHPVTGKLLKGSLHIALAAARRVAETEIEDTCASLLGFLRTSFFFSLASKCEFQLLNTGRDALQSAIDVDDGHLHLAIGDLGTGMPLLLQLKDSFADGSDVFGCLS